MTQYYPNVPDVKSKKYDVKSDNPGNREKKVSGIHSGRSSGIK